VGYWHHRVSCIVLISRALADLNRYTLAVGRAPFHASSKEEIYKKLKTGDYSWPELSSITNEISADLRDLVSSLLVSEELRPSPDQIVSHPFFRIAFVPRQMSRAQVSKVPSWPNVQPPSPEVLRRGYSESWWHVCKESGVGEYAPGKCFQLNAGKKIRSIVRDIEREVAAGRQPVIPIPSDTVYTSPNCNSIDAFQPRNALTEIAEEREPDTRQLKEISNNEVQSGKETSTDETKKKKDAELMPPPPRVRRAGPIRRTRAVPGDREANDKEESAPESTRQSSRLNTLSQTNPLSQTAFSGTNFLPSSSQPQSGEIIPASKRSVDASLARRPRKNLSDRDIPALADAIRDDLEIAPSRTLATRSSRSRSKQPSQEVVEIFDEQENLGRPVLPPPPTMSAKLPIPRRKMLEPTSTFPGSDPTAVLERLNAFRDNLASALERKHLMPSRRVPQQPSRTLPFVSRWVDYSKKHGVGYVLDDGTVGCVINGSAASGTPVTHVAVKNGERWLARIGKRFEHLERVPFRMFEDHGAAGLEKLDLASRDEKTRERLRMLRVLWVKFGRYMSQTLNATETADCADDEPEADSDLLFVRFYQRSGNVGIWGFSDGCVQVRFDRDIVVIETRYLLTNSSTSPTTPNLSSLQMVCILQRHSCPWKECAQLKRSMISQPSYSETGKHWCIQSMHYSTDRSSEVAGRSCSPRWCKPTW
jgi:myosin-1